MIGVLSKGYSFRSLAEYLLLDKRRNARGRIVGGVMAGRNPRQLCREFGKLRALNPKLGRAVAHFVLSPSPDDPPLSDDQFRAITENFMMAMGFGGAPWCAVAHDDSGLQHVHIMASRIDFHAKTIPDAGDFRRSEAAVRRIEREFGLVIVDSPPTKDDGPLPRAIENAGHKKRKKRVRHRPYKQRGTEPDTSENNNKEEDSMKTDEINEALPPHPFHPDDPLAKSWPEPHEPGRDMAEIAMIEEFGALAPSASIADDLNERKRREIRRIPHDDSYEKTLKEIFPLDTPIVRRYPRCVVLVFCQPQPNPGRLADHGDKIVALGARPDQDALNAERIVALALQRKWRSIKFSGSEQFVEMAMRRAMRGGITIHAQGEAQIVILAKLYAERQGGMGSMAGPSIAMNAPFDPVFSDPILAPLRELDGLTFDEPAQTVIRTVPPAALVALPPAPADTPETLADMTGYPLDAPLHDIYAVKPIRVTETPPVAPAKPEPGLLVTTLPPFRNLSERIQQRRNADAQKRLNSSTTLPSEKPRTTGRP